MSQLRDAAALALRRRVGLPEDRVPGRPRPRAEELGHIGAAFIWASSRVPAPAHVALRSRFVDDDRLTAEQKAFLAEVGPVQGPED
jgi:hypothetical protein